ncbi:unnamed protein product [Ambrosiozyma monospora]|uniref:Unnamed protein product n=1 Tax=Ambrosiozyma monospora TaxID=43982 RepID=A0ACB5SVY2_AMBMO|nr:unnamed protein product [Ambrosiozyma monospora]
MIDQATKPMTPALPYPSSTAITLASQLPIEIQCNILKFVLLKFLFFIRDTDGKLDDGGISHDDDIYGLLGSLYGSRNVQTQLASFIGYYDLLDDIICMAIEEAELYLVLLDFDDYPVNAKLIDFLSSRSVPLKSIVLKSANYYQPSWNLLKLIEFQCEKVHLTVTYEGFNSEIKDAVWLKFVNSLLWTDRVQSLKTSGIVDKFNDLIELTVHLYEVGEISLVEDILHGLEQKSHPLKELRIVMYPRARTKEIVSDFRTQLGNLITKNPKVDIQILIISPSFGFEYQWRLSSRLLPIPAFDLIYPLSVEEVDTLETKCRAPGLNHLSFHGLECDECDMIKISNSTIRSIHIDSFSLDHLSIDKPISLRELHVCRCDLNQSLFSNLPESMQEILIADCTYNPTSVLDSGIHLPLQLCSLELHCMPPFLNELKIGNIDQLRHLKKVSITIFATPIVSRADDITLERLRVSNSFALSEVQSFIDQLPNDLESLQIKADGRFRTDPDNCTICLSDAISFEKFTSLKVLKFYWSESTGSFDVSKFPSVDHLECAALEHLNGCFSEGILNLGIDLTSYEETLEHFLNTFVSNMTNLVSLDVITPACNSIDFRKVTFPCGFCSFKLYFPDRRSSLDIDLEEVPPVSIVLDSIPSSLNYFKLDMRHRQPMVLVVDDCKGETIASMKNRLCFHRNTKYDWVQYSHFDETEAYFIDRLYE